VDEPRDAEARTPAARRFVLKKELAMSDPLACSLAEPLASARAWGVAAMAGSMTRLAALLSATLVAGCATAPLTSSYDLPKLRVMCGVQGNKSACGELTRFEAERRRAALGAGNGLTPFGVPSIGCQPPPFGNPRC
jgi:hypothetical protein